MDIWHIESKVWPTIRVWRIDNENFQVIEKGSVAPILTNPNYSLIDQKYAALMKKLSTQVSFHSVKVFDFVLKTEYDNYIELKVENSISPDNIHDKNSEGLKAWQFNGEIFVSGELKNEFLQLSPDDFTFNRGFQFFGA
ncbi:hypothetical protein [Ferruginibacter sp.]